MCHEVKSTCPGIRLQGLDPALPLASCVTHYFPFLCLGFLIGKLKIVRVFTLTSYNKN